MAPWAEGKKRRDSLTERDNQSLLRQKWVLGGDAKAGASTPPRSGNRTLQLPIDELVAALRADLRNTEISEAQDSAVSIQGHITGTVNNWHDDAPGRRRAAIVDSTLVSDSFQTARELAIIQIKRIARVNVRHRDRPIHQPLARRRVSTHTRRAKEGGIVIRRLERFDFITDARIRGIDCGVAEREGKSRFLDPRTTQISGSVDIDDSGACFRGAKDVPDSREEKWRRHGVRHLHCIGDRGAGGRPSRCTERMCCVIVLHRLYCIGRIGAPVHDNVGVGVSKGVGSCLGNCPTCRIRRKQRYRPRCGGEGSGIDPYLPLTPHVGGPPHINRNSEEQHEEEEENSDED